MIARALLVVIALSAPAFAAPAPNVSGSAAMSSGGMVSLSLIEALTAVRRPELAGIFSFIAEKDAPFAFADLLARDKKAMKLYLSKLDGDRKAANGLTDWDHAVCASLVNLYASPIAATFGKPDEARMSKINQCVLSTVVPLEEIVTRRKR
ncbi:MAG: hypothetical protein KGJ84_05415 [Elusimicrobia bacterium]|nr:hypothetical protein [Elusimicrobiota bacterium]